MLYLIHTKREINIHHRCTYAGVCRRYAVFLNPRYKIIKLIKFVCKSLWQTLIGVSSKFHCYSIVN